MFARQREISIVVNYRIAIEPVTATFQQSSLHIAKRG